MLRVGLFIASYVGIVLQSWRVGLWILMKTLGAAVVSIGACTLYLLWTLGSAWLYAGWITETLLERKKNEKADR